MTEHPCKSRSKAQINAFEAIATNAQPRCAKRTIDALLADGLIAAEFREVGSDSFGQISIPDYYVPMQIHAQWCAWASENCRDDDEAE